MIYMECTINIMSKEQIDVVLRHKTLKKELPKGRYLVVENSNISN